MLGACPSSIYSKEFSYSLGTIQILRKHSEWVGGVDQMLMLYAKPEHFTSEVCLQGGWVGQEMVQNMLT